MCASFTHLRRAFPGLAVFCLISAPAFAQRSDVDRIVAFGASLTDSGNAFVYMTARSDCGTSHLVPPYDTLDDLLVPDGPYARGGHHFSNGATWLEELARSLALGGNARPALRNDGTKASNYAVGGARAVDFPCRFNLPDQLARYVSDFAHTSPSTLVAMEIGGNDVRDALVVASGGGDPSPVLEGAIGSLATSISQLYIHGARRFLILNVPNPGRTPAVRMLGPQAVAGAQMLAIGFNQGLATALSQLRIALPGIDLRELDVYTTLEDVVAQPERFGFVNTTSACVTPNDPPFACRKPDTYAFWDGIHPTRALHALVARQALARISAP